MRKLVFALGILLFGSPALAQTGPCSTSTTLAVNPTWVCIEPSLEHNAIDALTGQPVLTSYNLLFFAPGVDTATAEPIQTISVGKPTPNAQNAMWLQRSELSSIPVGQQYRARAIALGPSDVSPRSAESNPFGRSSLSAPRAPGRVSVTGAP